MEQRGDQNDGRGRDCEGMESRMNDGVGLVHNGSPADQVDIFGAFPAPAEVAEIRQMARHLIDGGAHWDGAVLQIAKRLERNPAMLRSACKVVTAEILRSE
jgi:hypothetical protein